MPHASKPLDPVFVGFELNQEILEFPWWGSGDAVACGEVVNGVGGLGVLGMPHTSIPTEEVPT